MTVPAETIYRLVMEVIDLREEIFRLQLCETVDQILARELDMSDDGEDLLAFHWPKDDYIFSEVAPGAYKPAFPCKETVRMPTTPAPIDSEHEGRRMPQVEE